MNVGENTDDELNIFATAAILLISIVTPVLAETGIQGAATRTTGDAAAPLPLPPMKRGNETLTKPWSAPVGHGQPRAGEVPAPTPLTEEMLGQEDANVDRTINNICRGC